MCNLKNTTKQWIYKREADFREKTSGYWSGEGNGERHDRGRGLRDPNY